MATSRMNRKDGMDTSASSGPRLTDGTTGVCDIIRASIASALDDVLTPSEQHALQCFVTATDSAALTHAVNADGVAKALDAYWNDGPHPKTSIAETAHHEQERVARVHAEEERFLKEAMEEARRQKLARWLEAENKRQQEVTSWRDEETDRQRERAQWHEQDQRRRAECAGWKPDDVHLPDEMTRWQEEDARRLADMRRWQEEDARRLTELSRWHEETVHRTEEMQHWEAPQARSAAAERARDSFHWQMQLTDDFIKSTKSVDKRNQGHILDALRALSRAPVTPVGDTIKPLTGGMAGLWRYRIGDYRLIYQPDASTKVVVLLTFAARGGVYA